MLRRSWTYRITDRWVLDKIGCERMLGRNIGVKKMKFFGHVIREGLDKSIPTGNMKGRQNVGMRLVSAYGHCTFIEVGA